MRFYAAEEFSADRLVTPFRQPPAALITASEVEAEGHSGEAVHESVVQFHSERKPFF